MNDRVMIIGGGGREHALAWHLDQSPHIEEISVAPGNAGTRQHWENVQIDVEDVEGQVAYAQKRQTDLVIIGPDASVAAGTADACIRAGIDCFGPTKGAGELEWSNTFADDFMEQYGIPKAKTFYGTNQMTHANSFIDTHNFEDYIIRAEGLADGKGVLVPKSAAEARKFIHELMIERRFGDAGNFVMFQERLFGEELSVFALCDGEKAILLPHCRDHKRLNDDDKGPNTGGMGVFAPVTGLDPDLTRQIEAQIIEPTLQGIAEKGHPYKGVLYVGIMLTADGPKVIEYNARFGDPETQALMLLMDEDLYPRLKQVARGELSAEPIKTRDGFAVTVALSAAGYPGKPRRGDEIYGLELAEELARNETYIFHGATKKDPTTGRVVTNGGRVLHIASYGETLAIARQRAYQAIGTNAIHFAGNHSRQDIAEL